MYSFNFIIITLNIFLCIEKLIKFMHIDVLGYKHHWYIGSR